MPSTLTVSHARGSYPVHIGTGTLAHAEELVRSAIGDRPTVTVTDSTLAPRLVGWGLRPLAEAPLTVPPGEGAKTREHWTALTDQLLARGLGRDGAIVAVGGGSVGDLAGFVAATYLRGIPVVQVPTTLLAMLDASVGGKVGVDSPDGKNLIGAFHPPAAVIADPAVLASLPARDYLGGMPEGVKHGMMQDADYFEWIAAHASALRARDPAAVEPLVRRSVEIKAAVVGADERETGMRAILNAGHTVAHALERVSRFSLPHGEAVALGLIAEAALAEQLGIANDVRMRVTAILSALGLPTRAATRLDAATVIAAMDTDKKNRGGEIHFALPGAIGQTHHADGRWTVPVASPQIAEALTSIL